MPIVKGREAVKRFITSIPEKMERGVLRGAAKAGGAVIMEEAKARVSSDEVGEHLQMKAKSERGQIKVRISIKPGFWRSVGTWLELGTDPHYISVDASQRNGRSVGRINRLAKTGTLVINGKPVGSTVFHPGARPSPWLRPALDLKERDAIAAAQSYINARVRRSGLLADTED
jgi:hypothetical protein